MSIKTEEWKDPNLVYSSAVKQLQQVCNRIDTAIRELQSLANSNNGELANLKHIHHKDYGDVTEILDDIESRINQISAKVNTKPSPDPEPDGYWECLTCRNNRVVDKRHAMTYGHAVEWREGTPPKAHADAHLHLDDYLPPSDEDLYKPYPTAGPNEIPIDDLRCPVCGELMPVTEDGFVSHGDEDHRFYMTISDFKVVFQPKRFTEDVYWCSHCGLVGGPLHACKENSTIFRIPAAALNALQLREGKCECDLSKNHRAVFADREYKFCPYCGGAL